MKRLNIRPMNDSDLAFAAECTAAEGWVSENFPILQGSYLHHPAGCLVAELAAQPVGICIATPYGDSGFVGELIVRPEARGQGMGAALLNHAVRYLQGRGARTVYLDGVVKAVELYERNGFRRVCRSWRFSGHLEGQTCPQVRPLLPEDLPEIFALDRQAFGADRSFFLARRRELFPELSKVMEVDGQIAGFILGRCGEGWVSAGPWIVAPEVEEPLSLLTSLTSAAGERSTSVGILDTHAQAVALARSVGFLEKADSPWRMALGPDDGLGASPLCYAVGSAAKG